MRSLDHGNRVTTVHAVTNPRKLCVGLFCLSLVLLFSVSAMAQVDVRVTWSASSATDLDGYRVYWGTQSGVYPNSQDVGNVLTYIINDLVEGTTYFIAVTAYDVVGNESAKSVPAEITVDVSAPVFSNIAAGSITENGATITWTTDEPSTSRVEYGETIGYGTQTALDTTLVTSHSVQISGLDRWTTYHYRVKSTDGDDNEGVSGDNTFTTDDTTDPVISNIQVTDIGDNVATVTWTTDEPATSRVDYGETAGYGQNEQDLTLKTSHSLTLSGLSASTVYHFRVRSIDENSNQASSADDTFQTTDTGAPVISGVSATNVTANSATIVWTTDEPATTVVHYGETAAYGTDATEAGLTTSHSVTITGLNDDTVYHYQVESADEAENSATSGDETFETPDETAPDAPTDVDAEVVS
jgi:hypothetical protein